jgi:hypothetical protein
MATTLLERSRQFLDREYDPRQRGVERGGDPCGAPGQHHGMALRRQPPLGHPSRYTVQDDGPHVHRRSLPADRAAAEERRCGKEHPADDHRRLEEPLSELAGFGANRENGLGDAAAFRAFEIAPRQPGDGKEAEGREQPGDRGRHGEQASQSELREIGDLGETHGGHADRSCRAPHQNARPPMPIGNQVT